MLLPRGASIWSDPTAALQLNQRGNASDFRLPAGGGQGVRDLLLRPGDELGVRDLLLRPKDELGTTALGDWGQAKDLAASFTSGLDSIRRYATAMGELNGEWIRN